MRPRTLILPLVLLTLLLIAILRLVGFIHLFFTRAGAGALTQEQIRDAHLASLGAHDGRKMLIPKIVHQVFHDWGHVGEGREGNETMPEDWEEVRRGCVERNGGWEFMLWTEIKSREFIRENYPWFLDTYDGYRFPVQRVDTVRYFLLRHYGGIYLDLDNGCLTNLEPLLYYPAWLTDGGRGALSNNILASTPMHPFWVLLTDSLIPYNYNYLFPYITISYASGQWFETAIWERYHGSKKTMKEEEKVYRIMMDDRVQDRVGEGKWVFFTQERGGTWVNWDNRLFLWVGDHLVLLAVGGVVLGGGGCWMNFLSVVDERIAEGWYILKSVCLLTYRTFKKQAPESTQLQLNTYRI
ncbi:uncharacterized protein LY89DRAFT_696850 [Mollisia scopiformis]|uniref:Mannosyl phosphorylinositol ceramide synthase SUR1 n=1 Tax=Mollisia scopiformis TaxID=149040 RepID=A0A194XCC9_MOLSC|nr:uncharacterized protein LY89DRAFT_696850 [Mollisia scopiformis]KUJ17407.1 hypothetical protein LY89DRAFT_696850 [Mollisia scopiformis]